MGGGENLHVVLSRALIDCRPYAIKYRMMETSLDFINQQDSRGQQHCSKNDGRKACDSIS